MADRDPRIGEKIAKLRHQKEMTQVEMAAALGVSPSTVADWERGASYPARKLGKIEQLLGPLDDEPERGQSRGESSEEMLRRHAAESLAAAERIRAVQQRRQQPPNGKANGNETRRAG